MLPTTVASVPPTKPSPRKSRPLPRAPCHLQSQLTLRFSCYNSCPNDPRAASAKSEVTVRCQNASLYGTTTKATKTGSSESSATADSATATGTDEAEESSSDAAASVTESAASPDNTNSAADLARNTGGLLLAVAGVVAAIL